AFAVTKNPLLLIVAGTIGVISPSGHEVGPFLSIEQAALSHVLSDRNRTAAFAWYTLIGTMATALGSLFAGMLAHTVKGTSTAALQSERTILYCYAAVGLLLILLFSRL